MTGPLHGIRIIDLTSNVAGPLATMILADQGAEVIKIEAPQGGDATRAGANRPRGVPGFAIKYLSITDFVELDSRGSRPGMTGAKRAPEAGLTDSFTRSIRGFPLFSIIARGGSALAVSEFFIDLPALPRLSGARWTAILLMFL